MGVGLCDCKSKARALGILSRALASLEAVEQERDELVLDAFPAVLDGDPQMPVA